MRLYSQAVELLLVIVPGFGRVIGDEEDAFLCENEGSDRVRVSQVHRRRGKMGMSTTPRAKLVRCYVL